MQNLTIKSAQEKLDKGEITSVELTEYYLNRIKEINPKINAFITVFDNLAIEMAKASDERRKKGQTLSEIDGIPIAKIAPLIVMWALFEAVAAVPIYVKPSIFNVALLTLMLVKVTKPEGPSV